MKTVILLFSISLIVSSCSPSPPKWTEKNFDESNIDFTNLDIRNVNVNGVPIYTDRERLFAEFGNPIDSTEDFAFSWEQMKNGNNDSIPYTWYNWKNISAVQSKSVMKITMIHLIGTENKLETPLGKFSSKTKLSDIMKIASDSYHWRNLGVTIFSRGYGVISQEDYENGKVTRLIFDGNIEGVQDEIELVFYKDNLAYVEINGFDLEYSKL